MSEIGVDPEEGLDAMRGIAQALIANGCDPEWAMAGAVVGFLTGYEVGYDDGHGA